jgi:hypothetical protein
MKHNQPLEFVFEQIQAYKCLKEATDFGRDKKYLEAYEAAIKLATHARLMAVAYRTWIKEEQ